MAKVTETKGKFDNVNDRLAKINITDKFSELYDNDWVKMSRFLAKRFPNIPEHELIHNITSLMKVLRLLRLHDDIVSFKQYMLNERT